MLLDIQESTYQILAAQTDTMRSILTTMQAMRSQSEAQTKELLTIRQQLEQAGRKKEWRPSLPQISLPRPSWAWLWAIPITVGLFTIWYASGALWNNLLIPLLQLFQ